MLVFRLTQGTRTRRLNVLTVSRAMSVLPVDEIRNSGTASRLEIFLSTNRRNTNKPVPEQDLRFLGRVSVEDFLTSLREAWVQLDRDPNLQSVGLLIEASRARGGSRTNRDRVALGLTLHRPLPLDQRERRLDVLPFSSETSQSYPDEVADHQRRMAEDEDEDEEGDGGGQVGDGGGSTGGEGAGG